MKVSTWIGVFFGAGILVASFSVPSVQASISTQVPEPLMTYLLQKYGDSGVFIISLFICGGWAAKWLTRLLDQMKEASQQQVKALQEISEVVVDVRGQVGSITRLADALANLTQLTYMALERQENTNREIEDLKSLIQDLRRELSSYQGGNNDHPRK